MKKQEPKIYLSRRNLLALLSKLDRQEAGDVTQCSIIKYQQPDSEYQQTMDAVMITAVADAVYYKDRSAGMMHPADEQKIQAPSAGVMLDCTTF